MKYRKVPDEDFKLVLEFINLFKNIISSHFFKTIPGFGKKLNKAIESLNILETNLNSCEVL